MAATNERRRKCRKVEEATHYCRAKRDEAESGDLPGQSIGQPAGPPEEAAGEGRWTVYETWRL